MCGFYSPLEWARFNHFRREKLPFNVVLKFNNTAKMFKLFVRIPKHHYDPLHEFIGLVVNFIGQLDEMIASRFSFGHFKYHNIFSVDRFFFSNDEGLLKLEIELKSDTARRRVGSALFISTCMRMLLGILLIRLCWVFCFV